MITMEKIFKYKNIFNLLGLMLGTVAFVNTMAYQGLQAFRYFTNQSNLLFLLVFLTIYFKKDNNKNFKIVAFITLISLTITGVVFHLLLTDTVGSNSGVIESIYDLNNFHNLVTHTINPLYYLIYYFIFIIDNIKIKEFYIGLIHPILYFIIILLLGPITNFYPYPFLDVSQNGLAEVLKMTLLIMLPLITFFVILLTTLKDVLNKRIDYTKIEET
ncbi:MAG TPA: Pr6Pr family membrane protein [Acholeplasma sp.]|nr:Pr6Pr family membrane protein [Acholeplasma sp.]